MDPDSVRNVNTAPQFRECHSAGDTKGRNLDGQDSSRATVLRPDLRPDAVVYDRDLGPVMFVDFADDIARRAAAAAPPRVLEVAAGTGIVSRRLRDLLPIETFLVVTDFNSAMLDKARAKFGSEEMIDFKSANALSLSFPDQSFDALNCQFGLMFFPDKEKACREAHRVLALGGHYIFSVWDAEHHNPVATLIRNVIARFCPADPLQFMEVPFSYHRIDPVRDMLDRVGFTGVRISVVGVQKIVEDVHAFAPGSGLRQPTRRRLPIAQRRSRWGGRRAHRSATARIREPTHTHAIARHRV